MAGNLILRTESANIHGGFRSGSKASNDTHVVDTVVCEDATRIAANAVDGMLLGFKDDGNVINLDLIDTTDHPLCDNSFTVTVVHFSMRMNARLAG